LVQLLPGGPRLHARALPSPDHPCTR
jgi:hypothetical protein